MSLSRHLPDDIATTVLGAALGPLLEPGMVVYLRGDLGAGKTTFARGVLRGRGYPGKVKSPTYTLVEVYKVSRLYLYHFDFYRLEQPSDWIDAGFVEYFHRGAICLVEWPEKAGSSLPPADLDLRFVWAGESRDIELAAHSESGRRCMSRLMP